MTASDQTSAHPPVTPIASSKSPQAEAELPPAYRTRLRAQITRSLKPKNADVATPDEPDIKAKTADERVEGALAAWGGLSGNSDAVEAMIAAQLVVTHELTMSTIADAFACSDGSRILLRYDLNNVCKMTRASLRQIETLARYRAWRMRSASEARQLEHEMQNAEADS